MDPPNPRGGVPHHSLGGRASLSSSSSATGTSTATPSRSPSRMANAPSTPVRSPSAIGGGAYASPADAKPADEPVPRSDVRQVVSQLSDAMNASLRQVAAQFGVADAVATPRTGGAPEDARVVVHELQKARRKERELQLLVDDLQTEQRVARERLALYSILALKLKRELINEKLAHIDSKKEVDEVRQQYERDGAAQQQAPPRSPDPQRLRDQRRGSYESIRGHSAGEDDPWTSPNKPTGSEGSGSGGQGGGGSGLQLSFGSFYSSRRPASNEGGDEEGGDDDERALGMQSLRNSLIGQFLPSSLLDSPQLTPTARAASSSHSTDNQGGGDAFDDTNEDETKGHASAQLDRELGSFALSGTTDSSETKETCDACGRPRAPVVVEVVDCGHRLCRPCDRLVASGDDPASPSTMAQCPRCSKTVTAVRRLDKPSGGDNQVEHLRLETSRPSTSDSTSTATALTTSAFSTIGSTSIAPLTLSLLSEMFESISMDELESFLKDASGQVSGAIERILQRHPSFNPALAAEVSVTAGPGAGGQKSGSAASLHRSGSSSIPSHQQQSQQQGQGGAAGGSNWKTEMCMYYLQGKCNKTRRTCSFAHGESDLVRTTTVKHTSSTSYKSRMCPLWLEGSCPKSRRECPLAHGENDLRDGLALLGQTASGAGGASAATGAIAPPALPTTAPRLQNYKTELCYYYLKGCCNFTKEECRFAHGESDLRTVESNTLEWSAQLGGPAGAADKSSMQHQHQFQQQYMQQYQPPQQPPPQPMPQHAAYGLPAPFVPQAHQYHQLAPQAMHPHQLQGPVPPGMQQAGYGGGGVQHQPPYRYMKSMDDTKPPRRPTLPRREATWSQPGYDSMGGDF